ncbi:bcl-2-like protein 15 [Pantherophis guttatus]|uniref:Bcl-2-like protein 15 n=1 Tax=Pantherophis guttatus TaxID=94885 RepID=A0A6P9BJB2_PANGU|nr:bcl-2-like protein 15 [Pantherophis guttatus]
MNNSMMFEEQTKQIAEVLFTTLYSRKQYPLQPRKMIVIEDLELTRYRTWTSVPADPELIKCRTQASRPADSELLRHRAQASGPAVDSASSFDPVDIAILLRSIRDQYKTEMEGQVQAVLAEESITKIKKFGEVAESLSRNWSSQTPGLEPERAFLAVVVKLFEKLIKKTHGDKGQINILMETINGNPEVRGYIERQGGWGNLGRGLNSP